MPAQTVSELPQLPESLVVEADVLFCDLGGEAVLLNQKTGKYFGLDAVGTRMWELIRQHGRLEQVYLSLLDEYDVSEDQLEHDLVCFVEELVDRGILRGVQTQS